uniref:Ig-like domain-containing protein n=1 Tax=Chrysemys picta bellii TaxID=8478 RepID=A0A8C3FFD1_CHRPI
MGTVSLDFWVLSQLWEGSGVWWVGGLVGSPTWEASGVMGPALWIPEGGLGAQSNPRPLVQVQWRSTAGTSCSRGCRAPRGSPTSLCSGRWMLRVGCSLRDDSPQAGVLQYAYDSQDFIGFDGQRGLWVAAVQPAVLSKRRWEADRPWCQFLWDWCEKMLPHSLTSCLRPVPPEVSVSCRDAPDGSVTLSCHARGFYPRPIHVSWVRDEEDILAETDSSGILPNADSTYYTQSSLEISLQQDGHRYACRVEHTSLPEPTLIWGKEGGLSPCALLPPFPRASLPPFSPPQ